jgi:4-carboxymuconolactone decarboxylase
MEFARKDWMVGSILREREVDGLVVGFEESLRRLAMIDEGFVHDELGLGQVAISKLDPKTVALLQVGVSVAIASSAVCVDWGVARAMAEGATEDEIADVLLAISSLVGLGRVVSAAPVVATALGYDLEGAFEEPNGQ